MNNPYFPVAASSGGSTFTPSGSVAYPVELAPCEWFWVASFKNSSAAPFGTGLIPGWTYADGPDPLTPWVGATVTAAATGSINDFLDSPLGVASNDEGRIFGNTHASVDVGHRIGFFDFNRGEYEGIYTVTALGDVDNPWTLTRAADVQDDPAAATPTEYVVRLANTQNCARTARSNDYGTGWVVFTAGQNTAVGFDTFVGNQGTAAVGEMATAAGWGSVAIGAYSRAAGYNSVVIGINSADGWMMNGPSRIVIGYSVLSDLIGVVPDYSVTVGSQSGSCNAVSKIFRVSTNGQALQPDRQGGLVVFEGSVTSFDIGDGNFLLGASVRLLNTTAGSVTVTSTGSQFPRSLNGVAGGSVTIPAGAMKTLICLSITDYWLA